MRVLLLGGTTFFGPTLARLCSERGFEVTLFTRGHQPLPPVPGLKHLRGDRTRPEDLRQGHGTWDLVFDNTALQGDDVRNLLKAVGKVGRYVLTSTVSVYRFSRKPFPAPWREEDVDHDARPAAEDPKDIHWSYARGKLETEKALRASSVPWSIVRPTVVYGPRDPKFRTFWYLARMLTGGPVLLPNSGVGSFRLVFSDDVARLLLEVGTRPDAQGRTFNAAQDEIVTLRELLDESARHLGVTPEYVCAPGDALGEWAGPHGALNQCVPDTTALGSLGFRTTPFGEMCRVSATWFKEQGPNAWRALLGTRPQELEWARRHRAPGP